MQSRQSIPPDPANDPVRRRISSKRSTLNSTAIIKALGQEARIAGLDGISASSVSHRAGLTTGAIYSRYENTDEMLIALWEKSVAENFSDHISEVISYVTSSEPQKMSPELIKRIERPTPMLGLGVEFMVVAQRKDEIGEVILPQITQLLRDAGLDEYHTPIQCAGVAIGASFAIGAILRSFITGTNPQLGLVLRGLRNAHTSAQPTTMPLPAVTPLPIVAQTGNPVRDALIDATASVMGKTGFNGATISRIARRSQLTTGTIYNAYSDKEQLMNDAVSHLLLTSQTHNISAKRDASAEHRPNFGLTDSFEFGLLPDRRTWLRFRQECIIASRHHRKTHNALKNVVDVLHKQMITAFPHINPATLALLSSGEQSIGYGYSTLFGYSDQLTRCDFNAIMLQIAEQNKLQ